MSNINFDNPWLLLLAVPIALLFIIPYAIAVRKENINGHNIASGVIHILLALLIAFVAAGTTIVTTVTETNVYVVADVSYSASGNLDTIDRYISELGNSLPRNSKMGVVTFGKNYQLLTPLGQRTQSVKNSRVDNSATDIISALRYTGELFREDVIKRIVLITDGKQTSETDANALKRQVDALAERNIHVDAIYLDDNIKDNAREVQLSAAEVTPTTFLNGDTYARLTVNCMCPETTVNNNGEIAAYEVETSITVKRLKTNAEGAEPETSEEIAYFTRGSNYYDIPLYTAEAGVYDYEVEIRAEKAEEDGNVLNNVISFTQEVSGRQKVLVVYKNNQDYDLIAAAYGDSADITRGYYLDDSDETGIKTSVEWINQFDEIVIANVDVTEIENWEKFLQSLDKAVQRFGKSLLTFGDTNIQNYTKGELKALSDMLPVKFGKSESGGNLYTLVIDTSRSMEQNRRLERAKNAAKAVVELLEDDDTVAVIEFNGSPDNVEPLTKLDDGGREKVIEAIDALKVRQGTNIPAALQFAVNTATGAGRDFTKKSMMVFSDGMNFVFDNSASQSLRSTIAILRDRGVVTSALDVGREGVDQNAAANAESLLKNDIAQRGGGEYMLINSDAALAEVIKAQLPEGINSSEGTTSQIYVNRRNDDVFIDGGDANRLANEALVDKFIYSRAKGAATTVMSVNFIGAQGSVTSVPLYSYWDYGNGKVASLTAGLTKEWMDMDESMRLRLIRGIFGSNVPEQKISEPFTVEIEATEGYAEVTLSPADTYHLYDAVTSIEITFDNGKKTTTTAPVPLKTAGSSLTHTFITGDEGKYTVKITYKESENAPGYAVERTVHLAYSSEYDSFALYDAGTLYKMIGAQGTVSENGSFNIVNDEKEVGLYNVSLDLPLLTACVVLFAVDIAVRKLKWEDIKSLFKRHKKVTK